MIACDSYDNAPAMQLADGREVFSIAQTAMRSGQRRKSNRPDLIVPENRSNPHTKCWADLEAEGFTIVPSARAAQTDQ